MASTLNGTAPNGTTHNGTAHNGTALNGTAAAGSSKIPSGLFSRNKPPSISAFTELCSKSVIREDYPLASEVRSNVPIYDASTLNVDHFESVDSLKDEWRHVLLSGPGVLVLKNMYRDKELLEKVNSVYREVIESEKAQSGKGDHFASGGKNDRIWNSFGKHGLLDPASFVKYYSNPWLSVVCDAWLGPGYRVTAQVNVVKPGGAAQVSHRDYHLGFQTAEKCEAYPIQMQIASQLLTLQGAVAHSDMPLASGPTRLLPFSQMFQEGYMAYRLPEFTQYFLENYIMLPLELGDGLFFNPALFHAAGENKTENFNRTANLLQVSSAFAKPMEVVDSIPLVQRCWEDLRKMYKKAGESHEVRSFVAAVAEGYPFPTNLDRRPPAPGGMAPECEQEMVWRGLLEDWSAERIVTELSQMREDSKA